MANRIQARGLGINQFGGFTPYGNGTVYRGTLIANAIGAMTNSSSNSPIGNGDTIVLQVLPEGYIVHDLQIVVSEALSAGVTADIGIEYVHGLASTLVPADPAYFDSAVPLGTVARLRTGCKKPPLPLAHEAWLILTIGGAGNSKAGRVDVQLSGERMGPE